MGRLQGKEQPACNISEIKKKKKKKKKERGGGGGTGEREGTGRGGRGGKISQAGWSQLAHGYFNKQTISQIKMKSVQPPHDVRHLS